MTKVLFVCTGNIDRSPIAEELLRGRTGFEVRSAGTMLGARRVLTPSDIDWADIVFAMENHHRNSILEIAPGAGDKVRILGIPDIYRRGVEMLVDLIRVKLTQHGILV